MTDGCSNSLAGGVLTPLKNLINPDHHCFETTTDANDGSYLTDDFNMDRFNRHTSMERDGRDDDDNMYKSQRIDFVQKDKRDGFTRKSNGRKVQREIHAIKPKQSKGKKALKNVVHQLRSWKPKTKPKKDVHNEIENSKNNAVASQVPFNSIKQNSEPGLDILNSKYMESGVAENSRTNTEISRGRSRSRDASSNNQNRTSNRSNVFVRSRSAGRRLPVTPRQIKTRERSLSRSRSRRRYIQAARSRSRSISRRRGRTSIESYEDEIADECGESKGIGIDSKNGHSALAEMIKESNRLQDMYRESIGYANNHSSQHQEMNTSFGISALFQNMCQVSNDYNTPADYTFQHSTKPATGTGTHNDHGGAFKEKSESDNAMTSQPKKAFRSWEDILNEQAKMREKKKLQPGGSSSNSRVSHPSNKSNVTASRTTASKIPRVLSRIRSQKQSKKDNSTNSFSVATSRDRTAISQSSSEKSPWDLRGDLGADRWKKYLAAAKSFEDDDEDDCNSSSARGHDKYAVYS